MKTKKDDVVMTRGLTRGREKGGRLPDRRHALRGSRCGTTKSTSSLSSLRVERDVGDERRRRGHYFAVDISFCLDISCRVCVSISSPF